MPHEVSTAPDHRGPRARASGTDNHYVGLDGLRGVAALAVVWYHFSARLDLPYLFAHGYLAVDFFFVLSGFVIARAYTTRLATGKLPLLTFCTMRLIRLLPLVILGTLIAAAIEWRRPGIVDQWQHLTDTILSVILGSALIPTLWQTTLEQVVFPLNGPMWSLFFEAVGNVVFAWLVMCRATRALILSIVIASGLAMIWGVWRFGTVDFGSAPPNFWFGFARIAWSFTVGTVLFYRREYSPRFPPLPILLGLVIIFMTPHLGPWDMPFDLGATLVAMPLVVLCASATTITPWAQKLAATIGNLSYPIYAVHYPLVRAFSVVGMGLHLSTLARLATVAMATVAITVVSAAIYKFYDVPIRRRLSALIKHSVTTKR